MHCVGVDIIEIERIEQAVARWGQRFLHRVYTATELKLCRQKAARLATRFAAKEAVMKALGTGARGISWREIEILSDLRGKPLVYLHGKAQNRATDLGLGPLSVSLSDSEQYAVAFVVGDASQPQ
ncbi:MAG: holo-ACP synthase [Chloroflexota bacterium]